MPATTPYPIRLSESLRRDITRAAQATSLTFPEAARQAILFGLPIVEKKLKKKAAK